MKFTLISTLASFFILFNLSFLNAYQERRIKLGIDVLIENNFSQLKGKRVGLLTNQSGRTGNGELTIEAFSNTDVCKLVCLYTPEHGFYTTIPAGESVKDDSIMGYPIYSLYGQSKKPLKSHIAEIDVIVVDIQDVGIRSYTYISTLFKLLETAIEHNKEVLILDRPNPIGGLIVDGNILVKGKESFIGIAPISYVHGCTIAELAKMFVGENWLKNSKKNTYKKFSLNIVKMDGWERWMRWEDTGLKWFPTSPHIPSVDAVRGAAMLGIFGELGIVSIGIGTTLPFQYVGNPDLKIKTVIDELGKTNFNGVTLNQTKYRPFYGKASGKDCIGFLLKFYPDNLFTPYTTGVRIMLAIRKSNPEYFDKKNISEKAENMFIKASGTDELFNAFFKKATDDYVMQVAVKGLSDFLKIRSRYLLYN